MSNLVPTLPSHRVDQPPDFVLYLGLGPGEVWRIHPSDHIPDILTNSISLKTSDESRVGEISSPGVSALHAADTPIRVP